MVAGWIHYGITIWYGAGLDTMRENEPFLVMVTPVVIWGKGHSHNLMKRIIPEWSVGLEHSWT